LINYSLCLFGEFENSVEESTNSLRRYSTGLLEYFLKLNHVDLKVVQFDWKTERNQEKTFEKIPKCDFLLTALYALNVLNNPHLAKEKVNYKTSTFLENKSSWDYSFGNLKESSPECYIPYPCSKRLFKYKEKIPKTILLDDHNPEIGFGKDISVQIMNWLEEFVDNGYKIYQLTKQGDLPHSKYIEPIFKCNYQEYMEKTSEIESFIMTHPGAYENSVIDMVARGTRVLVPIDQGTFKRYDKTEGFVPIEIIKDFELGTFKNKEQLINLIKKPIDNSNIQNHISMMTDMEEAVLTIDRVFQDIITNNNKTS
jgi:hypothetical protein